MKNQIKLKVYHIIQRAVDEGVTFGFHRAYKHTEKPNLEYVQEQITNAIMNSLVEVIDFGDENE